MHDTEDPTRSSAADAAGMAADYSARATYARGYEDGRASVALTAIDAALDDAIARADREADRAAEMEAQANREQARADEATAALEEMTNDLIAVWRVAMNKSVYDAAPNPFSAVDARDAVEALAERAQETKAALAAAADIAGRWVPADSFDDERLALVEHCDNTTDERDAAIARAEKAEANLSEVRDAYAHLASVLERMHVQRDEAWGSRDAAERARDEVGIQLAAAQAEIARLRPVVEAARHLASITMGEVTDKVDAALAALDTVPGDALGPVVPPSPAGASAQPSGGTPAASSATSSSSEAAGNPSASRGTPEWYLRPHDSVYAEGPYPTRDAAIADAKAYGYLMFHVGRCRHIHVGFGLDVDDIMERIKDAAYDEVECDDDIFDFVIDRQHAQDALQKWADEHIKVEMGWYWSEAGEETIILDDLEQEGGANPSAPRGTCDRITAALEASGIDMSNVKDGDL